MKNNNAEAIKRLSKKSLKANKGRNLVALIAIILTTFMITSVFSIGVSFANNMSIMYVRLSGTTADLFVTDPTAEQVSTISELDGVINVGTQINAGSVRQKNSAGNDLKIALLYSDSNDWNGNMKPAIGEVSGDYPTDANGIMLSQRALKQLGLDNPSIGQSVELTYRSKGENQKRTFTLTGWYTEFESAQDSGIALVSEAFCKEHGLTLEADGRLCADVKKSRSETVFETVGKQIANDGQKVTYSSLSDEGSSQSTLFAGAAVVLIALFIVLSGYLLIYNIMYISVTRDIHFYGLLKTIGASAGQIRTVVRRQAFLLSGIGVPVGLVLGLLTSFGVVPMAMSMFTSDSSMQSSAMPSDISFNPVIFIGTALFSFFTVAVSCRKPARLAGRVSPVEAVRYTGVESSGKKKERKSTSGGKLYKMAFHNVFRDKKRAMLVFASLFMGTVTFLSVFSFFSSLDVENYIDTYHPNDFEYQSIPPLSDEKFNDEFMEKLNSIDGITSTETVMFTHCAIPFDAKQFEPILRGSYNTYGTEVEAESYEDFVSMIQGVFERNEYGSSVYGVDDKYIEEYNSTHDDKIDIDAFRRGEVCLVGHYGFDSLNGTTLSLTDENSGNKRDMVVAGTLDDDTSCHFSYYSYTVGCIEAIYVSKECIESLNPNAQTVFIFADVDPAAEPAVKAQLKKLNSEMTNSAYMFTVKSDERESFVSTMFTMNVLTSGISFMLILIGVINFINVMFTGVFARRRELAVLESIGMTKKQIFAMLTLEGGFYALISSLLIWTLGSGIMFLIGSATPSLADYAVFHYPITEVVALTAIIIAVCLIVPPLVFKLSNRDTVTVRLRESEN